MRARIVLLGAAILFSGCPRPLPPGPPPTPEPTPIPAPTPPPPPYVPNKRIEVGKMFSGAQVRTTLETEFGTTATAERNDPSSYVVDVKVQVKIPKPHRELAELQKLNDQLPTLLPALPSLLEKAKISPLWDDLYRLKVAQLQRSLNRFDELLSRHNLFDCETMLEIQHPDTKRRVLLIQADMDTDSDGSDGDRVPAVDGLSSTFQPSTSYRWSKKTEKPNPFLALREDKLKQYETELATPTVSANRTKDLKDAIARVKTEIGDLKKYSFLVGATDPFVVLPLSMFGKKTAFAAAIGDYCVVIFGGTLYPAIVGDAGPPYKTGEGSLRLCKQLNARADVGNRPVNDLKVTYLVFPGSADKPWDAPDLEKWRARCEKLLGEIGGYKGELFAWEDVTKPKPPAETPPNPAAN
jgi:hypothetical protein